MKRIVGVVALLGIAVLALAGGLLSMGLGKDGETAMNLSSAETAMSQRYEVPLATLLYVGRGLNTSYEPVGGLGTRGWNIIQNDSLYEGFVLSKPAIGWYASQNESTIAWQLEQMQRAGISVVFISWQGWGDDDLDGIVDDSVAVQFNKTARVILDYIKDNRLPFRFSFMVEDFPNNLYRESIGSAQGEALLNLNAEQRQMVMDYLWDNYFSPETYGDIAFHWNGKPFLAGGANNPGEWWEIPGFSDPRFEFYEIYDKPQDEAEHLTAAIYTPPPSSVPGRDGIVITWPRHDGWPTFLTHHLPWLDADEDEENVRRIDPYGKEGAYDYAWKEIIEHRPRSDIKLVFVYYWNSFSEVTYLEPDSGLGTYAVGDLYIRKTAHYYNLFRAGLLFREYVADWVSLEEFRPTIGNVAPHDLGLASEYEKDALLRRLLRQSQDWVVQYTGRTFSGPGQNVVGWVEPWSTKSQLNVSGYNGVTPGTMVQIGNEEGQLPIEFAQVKQVIKGPNSDTWELAYPLKHDRKAGEVIVEVSPAGSLGVGEVPPSIKEATIRLAGNMWHYIVHTPKGRLMNFENIGVAQIDDSVFTDGIKRDLDLWKKRGRMKVYSP